MKRNGSKSLAYNISLAAKGVAAVNLHLKAVFTYLRYFARHVSAADKTKPLIGHFAAYRLRHSEERQKAFSGLFVDLRHFSGQIHHHGHGVFRNRASIDSGRVPYRYAALSRSLSIDPFQAHTVLLDQLAFLCPADHLRRTVLLPDDDSVQFFRMVEIINNFNVGFQTFNR